MRVRSFLRYFKYVSHVCVRYKLDHGYQTVVGGSSFKVVSSVGDCKLSFAYISSDGILILFIDPVTLPLLGK